MRSVPSGLLADYQKPTTTLCHLIKLVRTDGFIVGYTTHDMPLTVSGLTYQPGLDLSNISTAAGWAVGNLEISVFPDAVLNAPDLIAGLWRNAAFLLSICNWTNVSHGIDTVKAGTVGEAQANEQGFFVIEFRGLMQAFQQPLGELTQATCRAELGDSRCLVDLTPFTHSHTVTTLGSQTTFTSSDATELADYYTEGKIQFTSGANAPYGWFKVKVFAFGGLFTLSVPLPKGVALGDVFTAIAGCQKRAVEDCAGRYSNILNFQGEPDVPGQDLLTADPTAPTG